MSSTTLDLEISLERNVCGACSGLGLGLGLGFGVGVRVGVRVRNVCGACVGVRVRVLGVGVRGWG